MSVHRATALVRINFVDYFFKTAGVLLAVYTVYAGFVGSIYAKSGAWGRTVSRRDSPSYFWVIVVIYAALSVALVTIF